LIEAVTCSQALDNYLIVLEKEFINFELDPGPPIFTLRQL
jgi:hypothetical protein